MALIRPSVLGASQDLEAHIADTDNPHATTAAQTTAIPTAEKGAVNGVATLDEDAKLAPSQVPSNVILEGEDAALLGAGSAGSGTKVLTSVNGVVQWASKQNDAAPAITEPVFGYIYESYIGDSIDSVNAPTVGVFV